MAAAAGVFGPRGSLADEGPPETTTIRLIFDPDTPVLCFASQYVAEQFLRMEGFTEVRYVPHGSAGSQAKTLVADEADITAEVCADWVVAIDRGDPVVVLSGLHAGLHRGLCQRSGSRHSRTQRQACRRDRYGQFRSYFPVECCPVHRPRSNPRYRMGSVEPERLEPPPRQRRRRCDHNISADELRYSRQTNRRHVILNTTIDEPWRHYLCCMVGARREFIQNYPMATKRALRALLKANELCSSEPQRTARWLVDRGYASRYDHALQTLRDVPYGAWRSYDPEDTMRFFALRLREAGMITSTPNRIIAEGTDWRFVDELKRELKA